MSQEILVGRLRPQEELGTGQIREACELLRQAKSQASELLQAAQAEAEEMRQRAYQLGFETGAREATVQSFDTLQLRNRLISTLAGDLQEAVLHLVEEICGSYQQIAPEVFAARLREALLLVRQEPSVVVFVSPADRKVAENALGPLELETGLAGQIEIRENPGLNAGALSISTNGCLIQSSREIQTNLILDHFRGSSHLTYELENAISRELEELLRDDCNPVKNGVGL